ncbi:unnamed protein product [Linum trigynum]|uniref:Uncharacterized protein n=1 Tax=Linum trigynum TaxID=586398 RepID=A0AAV2E3J9_9ROSI
MPCSSQSLSLYLNRITIFTKSLVTGPKLLSHGMPKITSNPYNASTYKSRGTSNSWILTETPSSFAVHRSGVQLATFTSKGAMATWDVCSRRPNSSPTKLREAPLSTRPSDLRLEAHLCRPSSRNSGNGADGLLTRVAFFLLPAAAADAKDAEPATSSPRSPAGCRKPVPRSLPASATCFSSHGASVAAKGAELAASSYAAPVPRRRPAATRSSRAMTFSRRVSIGAPWSPSLSPVELMSTRL